MDVRTPPCLFCMFPGREARAMLSRLPAVPLAAALALGIVLAITLLPARQETVVGCWLGAVFFLYAWWRRVLRSPSDVAVWLLWASVALAGAAWGLAWHGLFPSTDLSWRLSDQPVPLALEGVVTQASRPLPGMLLDPDTGDPLRPATETIIRVRSIRAGDRWIAADGHAAVVINGLGPGLIPGWRVRLFGRGLVPQAGTNPGEYSFADEARARRCLSVVRCASWACVTVLHESPWWYPGPLLERIRRRGSSMLKSSMSADLAALADALLLGNREWLPREQTEPFLVTGTIHILAISGLHIGILAWALFRLVRVMPLSRGWSLATVACVSGGYMLLVHAEVPVVRATLIVWLACLASWLGRRPVGINSLAVVAILVIIRQPVAVFQTGTQLSFLSTGVLILLATAAARLRQAPDPIARLIEQSRHPFERRMRTVARGVGATVIAGAAVWVVTAPLVAMRFHIFSPIAPVLNPLIAPLVAVAMILGFSALVIALGSPWLASFPAAACGSVLQMIQSLASMASVFSQGHAWVSGPSCVWVVGWYAAVVWSILIAGRVGLRRCACWCLPCVVWLAFGVAGWAVVFVLPKGQQDLEVTLASMRHGLGILVRPPSGEVLVYDAGRLGAPAAARRAMEAVLRDSGITRIDLLVISHADSDHFNAVGELMRRFRVRQLAVSPAFAASESAEAQAVLAEARNRNIPVLLVTAGATMTLGTSADLTVLHPLPGRPHNNNDNAESLVITVEAAGRRLLLTGDIDGDAVDGLIARGVPTCDAMVAPHHGSLTSLPPRLAEAVRPRVVLVSGNGNAGWEEVREAYSQTGPDGHPAEVACTCRQGAIRLRMGPAGISLAKGTSRGWQRERRLAP
jgi:competence protein ComEC